MFRFVLAHLATLTIDLAIPGRRGDRDHALEPVPLRRQVRLLQRPRQRPPWLTRAAKPTLAVPTAAPAGPAGGPGRRPDRGVILFKPDTILAWHRALVRRKLDCRRTNRGLGQQTPVPFAPRGAHGPVSRRDVLGGPICEYVREAA